MRQIFLDTETTGLSADNGDRIIEIGCVELVNRKLTGNNRHFYLHPEDRAQVADGFVGLSERSKYLRFLTGKGVRTGNLTRLVRLGGSLLPLIRLYLQGSRRH